MSAVGTVITSGTGVATTFLRLGPGDHVLDITWAGGAGDTGIVSRALGDTRWIDVEDSSGVIAITTDASVRVSGNREYTLDVTTHTSAASMKAGACE
jgi:hypothetical protein